MIRATMQVLSTLLLVALMGVVSYTAWRVHRDDLQEFNLEEASRIAPPELEICKSVLEFLRDDFDSGEISIRNRWGLHFFQRSYISFRTDDSVFLVGEFVEALHPDWIFIKDPQPGELV